MSPRTEQIAKLNDQLRTTFLTGKVVLTEGIAALKDHIRLDIASRVQTFRVFNEDNDPHGERDFGAFEVDGVGQLHERRAKYRSYLQGLGIGGRTGEINCLRAEDGSVFLVARRDNTAADMVTPFHATVTEQQPKPKEDDDDGNEDLYQR